jgi:hypothetical protein
MQTPSKNSNPQQANHAQARNVLFLKLLGISYHWEQAKHNPALGPGLLLRRTNMRIVYFCRELETRNRLLEMCLEGRDHDEHEGLGVTAQRVLEEVCQLITISMCSTQSFQSVQ